MVAASAVPVEEYLHTCYEPDMEYVNGQLVERNVGEYFHGLLQLLIGIELSKRQGRRFRVFAEVRVRINAEPRYRIPDICVKALPHKADPIIEKPDLVVEILSPDDRTAEMLRKIADYLQAGIPHIWIVDPYQRTVMEADAAGFREAIGLTLQTDLVGSVNFADLFAELDSDPEFPVSAL
jgi:Uma2 family endonuclease